MKFSIVICSYNPDKRLLKRAIDSCVSQNTNSSSFEIILVDNNSEPPLNSDLMVTGYCKSNPNIFVLQETRQGLAFARATGIKAAKGEIVVFVDDDNQLNPDYLTNLSEISQEYPHAAVIGPGKITLDFIDGAPDWIRKHFGHLYQQKNRQTTQFGCEKGWPDYYPAGSGLCVKKTLLDTYLSDFQSGKITATGRKGTSMASAEDSQIVWTAVKQKSSAGTSPRLQLVHIIPGKRLNLNYLKKLNYGISSSYYPALKEMFPDYEFPFHKRTILSKLKLGVKTLFRARFNPLLFYRMYAIENAWLQGYDDYVDRSSKPQ